MNKWKWLVRILLLFLLLCAFLTYKFLVAAGQGMPLQHRVPIAGWRLYSHYRGGYHTELRFVTNTAISEYRWSN